MKSPLTLDSPAAFAAFAACVWLQLSLLCLPCGKGDEGEGNPVSE